MYIYAPTMEAAPTGFMVWMSGYGPACLTSTLFTNESFDKLDGSLYNF